MRGGQARASDGWLGGCDVLGFHDPEEVPHVAGAAGCRRSSSIAGNDSGRSRRAPAAQQGPSTPADPPTIEEIVAVIRHAGNGLHGDRLRGLVIVLWRAGLRIHEALLLNEGDLDRRRGSLLCGAARAAAAARSG